MIMCCVQHHVLQLMLDNSLRDCLEDMELNHSDIVQDYKKLSKRKMVSLLMLSSGWWWC